LHEATVLNYSEAGRTRAVMLPAEAVGPVRRAVERYRAAQRALEDQANAGLAKIVEAWGAKRLRPRPTRMVSGARASWWSG